MKVGILGSGDVGLKLGDGFLAVGDTVKIGTRNTSGISGHSSIDVQF